MSFLQGLFGSPDIDKMKAKGDVKGLIKALGYQKDPNVRRAAALALGKISDARAIEPLITALHENDKVVRQEAASALGVIGDVRAVKPLITALVEDNDVHQVTIGALVEIGRPAVEPLIAALKDNYVRDQVAVEVLVKIGKPAVEPLIAALKDVSKVAREAAAEALGKIGNTGAVEPLIATLKDMYKYVRQAAAEALDRLSWRPGEDEDGASYWAAKKQWDKCIEIGTPAIETLIAALGDEDHDTRRAAVEALGVIGNISAIEPLIAALLDNDRDVRHAAAEALVKIGEPAVEPLIAALNGGAGRQAAAEVLGQIGDARAVEPIIDHNRCYRLPDEVAVEALVKIGKLAVEPLITALHSNDRSVRHLAVEVLVKIGKPAVEPLISALHDNDKVVRHEAASALGVIGDARAVKPLIAALHDHDGHVREMVAEALDRLGWRPGEDENGASYWAAKKHWDKCIEIGTPAIEPLIAILSDENHETRRATVAALIKIGKPAVEPLITTLHDNDKFVRQEAASALDRLGWRPGEDEEGASYWLAKKQLYEYLAIFKKMGEAPAVEPLCTALKDDALTSPGLPGNRMPGAYYPGEHLYWEHVRFREALVSILGNIADPRAVETLTWVSQEDPHCVDMLENEEIAARDDRWPIREAAKDALEKIANNPVSSSGGGKAPTGAQRQVQEATAPPVSMPRPSPDLPDEPVEVEATHSLTAHKGAWDSPTTVTSLVVTRDGRRAVTGSWDATVKVWDLGSWELLRTLDASLPPTPELVLGQIVDTSANWINCVALTPDDRFAVAGSNDNLIRVWDLESGALIRTLSGHSGHPTAIAVTPDGHRVVSGAQCSRVLESGRVWDLANGAYLLTLQGAQMINAVAITPDGRLAVCAMFGEPLTIWDLATGAIVRKLRGGEGAMAVAITADGLGLVSGEKDGSVKLWEIASGTEVRSMIGLRKVSLQHPVAVTPDGRLVISGGTSGLLAWDLATGHQVCSFVGDLVSALAVTPDGQFLLSAHSDFNEGSVIRRWPLPKPVVERVTTSAPESAAGATPSTAGAPPTVQVPAKPNKWQVTVSSDKHNLVVTTSFPSQAAAEEVLVSSTDSEARLSAATALGKTDSLQVVPALAKALLSDQDNVVREVCAGYLGSIKGTEAEKSLLQAMADPNPYVRKKIVEALFRLGTEQARKAIDGALKDVDAEVRAEAERYTSKTTKKIHERLCPFLSDAGMCEPPGVSDLSECSWETQGRGHYNGCFVYKMYTHPSGPGDFLRRNT